MRREHDRVRPLEADLGSVAVVVGLGPDVDELDLLGGVVVALQRLAASRRAADRTHVHDVRVTRLGRDVPALGGAGRIAVGPVDGAETVVAGHRDARVVLLRSVHHVRKLVVGGHVVELRGQLVVDRRPRFAGVERHPRPAVVATDHAVGVGRIDPQRVVVAVRCVELHERLAAVDRSPCPHVHDEHLVGIGGVGDDVLVVPRAPARGRASTTPSPTSRRSRRNGRGRGCGPRLRPSRTPDRSVPATRRHRSCRACHRAIRSGG